MSSAAPASNTSFACDPAARAAGRPVTPSSTEFSGHPGLDRGVLAGLCCSVRAHGLYSPRTAVPAAVRDGGIPTAMVYNAMLFALLVSAAFGCVFMIVAAMLVPSGVRRERIAGDAQLPVTILVPLHGDEPGLFDNLAAFCDQDYAGPVQIIFGVTDPRDPAIQSVERLRPAGCGRQIDLVVSTRVAGSNPKVSNLVGMSPSIRHDVIVLVDSDIRVERDYLRRVVGAL